MYPIFKYASHGGDCCGMFHFYDFNGLATETKWTLFDKAHPYAKVLLGVWNSSSGEYDLIKLNHDKRVNWPDKVKDIAAKDAFLWMLDLFYETTLAYSLAKRPKQTRVAEIVLTEDQCKTSGWEEVLTSPEAGFVKNLSWTNVNSGNVCNQFIKTDWSVQKENIKKGKTYA